MGWRCEYGYRFTIQDDWMDENGCYTCMENEEAAHLLKVIKFITLS